MRFFNTAGPIQRERHYNVPPLERLDVDELLLLIRQWKYFVLHAPRQTGKTSALLVLRDELNAAGEVRCVYVNVEVGQTAREDVGAGMRAILSALASAARHALDDGWLASTWPGILETAGPHDALRETLSRWAESDAKPIVLLIDEIDALIGDTLLAVLRQLRAGYPERPRRFPQCVVLCGVRDVRDYRIRSDSENAIVAGGSAFNVRAKSLRLGDFSPAEVDSLLAQHTAETGQAFTSEARGTIWELTRGQPWLVNALAYETCFDHKAGRDRSRPITAAAVQDAREQLIRRRETHLDQLTDKLQEERVRRVVEPLLSGTASAEAIPADDIEYVRDLGLVRTDDPVAIANPIYREVIPRELTFSTQATLADDPALYVGADGALQVDKPLAAFQAFFREHSEHWVGALPVQGGRPATAAAGVPAAHRQQRRTNRTRVRPGPYADGSADRQAKGRRPRRAAEGGHRVQGAAPEPRRDASRRAAADAGVHGPLCGGGSAPRHLRPHRGEGLGREGLPPGGRRPWGAGHGLGDVR